ncbi:unnamed protein product [Adineta steineri]|uniref:JmjC domain-containing protein n=1 Tax=Adineta steineri TaxID=433720 RepID=A0A813S136_9BILA|nr:unnamed protein product [Adineta steineri]
MHEGSPKFWYIVPPSHADQLERCLRDVDILDTSHCQASLRHKTLFLNPFKLAQLHNIPVYRIEQCPNEIIVIFPRAYNWGFDGGFNVTESINFALPSWIPFGRCARSCLCQRVGNPVELDMDPFTKENLLTYTQTHLNSQLLELDHILMESDKQPILDLGITSPFLHVGMYGSIFALHTEEHDLSSMNYMHEGSHKFWYIVPPSHANQLERCLLDVDILDTSHCQASLRHKTLFPNPFELAQLHNIPVYRIEQCPNEIIIIFPRAYNWGFDGGFNVTESINFALPSWISFGRSACSCLCQQIGNPVELDMDPFTEENVLIYTQTHLNSQLLELNHILMESDKQPILDLELVTSNVQAAMFTYLSSEETDALMDDDFSIYFSVSPPQTTSVVAYTAENEQPLLSLSTSRTTKSTEELPFDHCTSLEIGSIILRQDEIAAETARIRRKWVE